MEERKPRQSKAGSKEKEAAVLTDAVEESKTRQSKAASKEKGAAALTIAVSAFRSPCILGAVMLFICVALALGIPNPTDYQLAIFAIFVSAAAAAFSSDLLGSLEFKTAWVSAGGSSCVFLFSGIMFMTYTKTELTKQLLGIDAAQANNKTETDSKANSKLKYDANDSTWDQRVRDAVNKSRERSRERRQ
jgi:hypothetical protein